MARTWAVVLLLATLARAEDYTHPAGLYALPLPEGWAAAARVDREGRAARVFAPAGDLRDGGDPVRGLWIWVLPVVSGERPEAAALTGAAAALVTAGEAGLRAAPGPPLPSLTGAIGLSVEGTRAGKPWKGAAAAVCRDDLALVVLAGGPPGEFDTLVAQANAALARLVAPVPLAPRHPGAGKAVEPPDVAEAAVPAAPLVHVQGRIEGRWTTIGHGSAFLIRADGYAITNRHVVDRIVRDGVVLRETFDPVVLSWDHSVRKDAVPARVVAVASRSDLALLRLEGEGPWPVCPITPPADVRTGHGLLVMGWPAPAQFGTRAITINEGTLALIVPDAFGRPARYRVGGGVTTHGNSGGPVFDLDRGGVAGVLTEGIPYVHDDGTVEALYRGLVPAYRILEEFPQVAAALPAGDAAPEDLRAVAADLYAQGRLGAVMLQCDRLEADDGVAHLMRFRVYRHFRDGERAKPHLLAALRRPESRWLAVVEAGRAALADGDLADAEGWAKQAAESEPARPEGKLLLGHARFHAGRWSEAAELFAAAAALARAGHHEGDLLAEAEAMQGLCLLQQMLDGWDGKPVPLNRSLRAEELLAGSLERRPFDNGATRAALGLVRLLAGEGPETVDAPLRAALACGPHDPFAVFRGEDHSIEHLGTWDAAALAGVAQVLLTRRARPADVHLAALLLRRADFVRPSAFIALLRARAALVAASLVGDQGAGLRQQASELLRQAQRLGPQTVWGKRARDELRRLGG